MTIAQTHASTSWNKDRACFHFIRLPCALFKSVLTQFPPPIVSNYLNSISSILLDEFSSVCVFPLNIKFWDSSILLHILVVCYFLLLSHISLYEHTSMYYLTYCWIFWVLSSLWLLWIGMISTFLYTSSNGIRVSLGVILYYYSNP